MRKLNRIRSFRDPDGFVFQSGKRIFRCVLPQAAEDALSFLNSPLAASWMARGILSRTEILQDISAADFPEDAYGELPVGSLILEHDPVSFPTYPYEWPPEMLRSAGVLTLELAQNAMHAGFALKDATPYNVMWNGPKPVFLDLLSFRKRDPRESTWHPYAQFVRTFVYPLLASQYFGLQLDEILFTHRDGLDPRRLLALCPAYHRLLPPFLGTVTIPALMDRGERHHAPGKYGTRVARDAEEASFILERLFARASRLLKRIPKSRGKGPGVRYMESGHNYEAAELAEKERFLNRVFEHRSPQYVLDIGSNTGRFSLAASRHGARVVAIDRDPEAAGALWRASCEQNAAVLPLVIDIARPPGPCGWANHECAGFLDRARGNFDCVLLLALIHHLLVNERVSLRMVLELATELTTRLAVVEYIDPADSQFQLLARGRGALHADLNRERFESEASRCFRIVESQDLTSTRRIYLLEKVAS